MTYHPAPLMLSFHRFHLGPHFLRCVGGEQHSRIRVFLEISGKVLWSFIGQIRCLQLGLVYYLLSDRRDNL